MKILIPTAKELNLKAETSAPFPLSEQQQRIVSALAAYSTKELADFYRLSLERAEKEERCIQDLAQGQASSYPALHLFDGLMYRHIQRANLSAAERDYLQRHVCITSALYGVIPALTGISPHRLDFLMPLRIEGRSLKRYWQEAYDQAVAEDELLISLLSSEFETVFSKEIRDRMLTFKFLEEKSGQLKLHSTISKKARGAFLTAMMADQVTDAEQIKKLSFAGFAYRADLSDGRRLVFVKPEP